MAAPTAIVEGMVRRDPPLPVQIRVHTLGDADDRVLVASIRDARDIQAARAAEVARMQAEARYRELVEQIPAVVYADEGGEETTYVSPQVQVVLGVTPEAYKADADMWLRMIHPDDRTRVQAQSEAFIAGVGGDLDDYRMIRPDGKVVWIRDRAFAVRDERGRILWEHGILFDVTELKDAEARIAHMAYHDALTGLANRAAFEDALSLAIGRARRSDLWVAVLFLDLDNFKGVNDSLGHHAGDQLLGQLADRLRACTRETDLVARQGGDEFLLLLADLEGSDAVSAANRVATRVEEALADPFTLRAGVVEMHGSLGISLYPEDAEDETSLMQHADTAMYRAKRAARGGHVFWTQDRAAGRRSTT
jgi:diguanylate cyclase (GGDEF)-like protein/PAS domain S-box-containing protein